MPFLAAAHACQTVSVSSDAVAAADAASEDGLYPLQGMERDDTDCWDAEAAAWAASPMLAAL